MSITINKHLKTYLGILSGLLSGFLLMGLLAPQDHEGKEQRLLGIREDSLWNYLTDYQTLVERRKNVDKVTNLVAQKAGQRHFLAELNNDGLMEFEVLEQIPAERLVIQVTKTTEPIEATWTYELEARGNKTMLTIHERSVLKSFWDKARFAVIGRGEIILQEMNTLERKFPPQH